MSVPASVLESTTNYAGSQRIFRPVQGHSVLNIIVKSENMFTLHTLVGAGLPSPYANECVNNYEIYYKRFSTKPTRPMYTLEFPYRHYGTTAPVTD